MLLPPIRQSAVLVRRRQRFLADVVLADGSQLTVHCPNSGAMRGCSEPGSPVVVSKAGNPQRKHAWTLEMVQSGGVWVGVNTGLTNKIVREALDCGLIDDFGKILSIQPEVRTSERSRLDFLLQTETGPVYLEAKSCSLVEDGMALFPDAVTERGARHLRELARLRSSSVRAAVLFCVQRADGLCFAPARHVDPAYADALRDARAKGVQVVVCRAEVTPEAVTITSKMDVCEGFS